MIPAVTVDLRGYDFDTLSELRDITKSLLIHLHEIAPNVMVCGFVMSEHQHKMLNVERYMKGEPIGVIKTTQLNMIDDVPVIIADERIQCPAYHLHDTNQAWYDEL